MDYYVYLCGCGCGIVSVCHSHKQLVYNCYIRISITIIHVYIQWVLVEVLMGCYFRSTSKYIPAHYTVMLQ